jgi:hypothetical protein
MSQQANARTTHYLVVVLPRARAEAEEAEEAVPQFSQLDELDSAAVQLRHSLEQQKQKQQQQPYWPSLLFSIRTTLLSALLILRRSTVASPHAVD